VSATAACRNDRGDHNNADEQGSGGDPGALIGGPDAAAAGTQITTAPPPVGTTYPTPGDTNQSVTTPVTAPTADTGRAPEGNAPGATQGTQPQKGP
jgi:hypothetical protein